MLQRNDLCPQLGQQLLPTALSDKWAMGIRSPDCKALLGPSHLWVRPGGVSRSWRHWCLDGNGRELSRSAFAWALPRGHLMTSCGLSPVLILHSLANPLVLSEMPPDQMGSGVGVGMGIQQVVSGCRADSRPFSSLGLSIRICKMGQWESRILGRWC